MLCFPLSFQLLTPRRKFRRRHEVHTLLISIKLWVDLSMSVYLSVCAINIINIRNKKQINLQKIEYILYGRCCSTSTKMEDIGRVYSFVQCVVNFFCSCKCKLQKVYKLLIYFTVEMHRAMSIRLSVLLCVYAAVYYLW